MTLSCAYWCHKNILIQSHRPTGITIWMTITSCVTIYISVTLSLDILVSSNCAKIWFPLFWLINNNSTIISFGWIPGAQLFIYFVKFLFSGKARLVCLTNRCLVMKWVSIDLKYELLETQGSFNELTHFPLDKMAAILPDDIFRCIFVNEKLCILIKTHWRWFPRF